MGKYKWRIDKINGQRQTARIRPRVDEESTWKLDSFDEININKLKRPVTKIFNELSKVNCTAN